MSQGTLPPPTDFMQNGFSIHEGVLSPAVVSRFVKLVDGARQRQTAHSVSSNGGIYGLRNLTEVIPETAELLQEAGVVSLVRSVLNRPAFMVRATLFDKLPTANWGVFWHQDLSIAVVEKHTVPGFSAFTRKAGILCVQPPIALMGRMLAVRLHLDACTEQNGALKVLPGTHQLARLSASEVDIARSDRSEVVCEVGSGGAVLMRPLLLHASSQMQVAAQRRVIHFEFADFELPAPLQWRFRIPCGALQT